MLSLIIQSLKVLDVGRPGDPSKQNIEFVYVIMMEVWSLSSLILYSTPYESFLTIISIGWKS